jgi:hypothetical protein
MFNLSWAATLSDHCLATGYSCISTPLAVFTLSSHETKIPIRATQRFAD